MKHVVAGVALVFALLFANPEVFARSIECSALVNSAEREPDWHAERCGPPRSTTTLWHEPAPHELGDLAFQLNLRGGPQPEADALHSFLLPNADAPTVIGPQAQEIYGLEFDSATGILWGVSNARELGQLDTLTGEFQVVALMTGIGTGETVTGLAFLDGQTPFYLSTSHDSSSESLLYTVDPASGAATLVGPMGVALMIEIAINAEGAMYGHSVDTDSIYSIDPATGVATLVGPTGYDANFAQGMAFDRSTGVLYAWLYQGGGVNTFATIDLATGAATPVATPPLGEYEGAITSPGISDRIFRDGFDARMDTVLVHGTGAGPVPDDSPACGTPGTPLEIGFDVAGIAAPVSGVRISVTGGHSWVGDLVLTLAAPGGNPSLPLFGYTGATSDASFGDSSGFAGPYTFTDDTFGDWWGAAADTPADLAIPPGSYRTSHVGGENPDGGLPTSLHATFGNLSPASANGRWTLTAIDLCPGETGTIGAAGLTLEYGP